MRPGSAPVPVADELSRVVVQGQEITATGNESLLELLRRNASAVRLGERAPAAEQPLVLLDGVVMGDGIRALAGVLAFHAAPASPVGSGHR